jgi:hypothetical protein
MKLNVKRNSDGSVKGLRILNLPAGGKQRIHSDLLVDPAVAPHISHGDTSFTFHTLDGDVVFNIDREPGRYCLTCGEQLPDFAGNGKTQEMRRAAQCRAHIATHGKSAETSTAWPHGYESYPNSYLCSIDDQRG